ncbi:MAG: sigma-70 family RNA polymerase sigma factor [Acidobacteria bacterium]|nr:sigma-70 family RNA polymerase sigma factor [Acidobacteriota bacterium]
MGVETTPGGEPDEKSRIRSLQAGSEEAFDSLIAEYTAPVFRLAYRILNDRADAADAVQEVFLKVFRNIGEFQGDSSLKTWIYRITVNTAANQNRWWRRHKEQEYSLDAPQPGDNDSYFVPVDQAQNPFESLLSRETQEMVRTAMASLPDCFRTVLVLREMESLSYEEIAEILHISLGTVKSRLARARQALKSELESLIESGPARFPVWNPAE